MTSDIARKITVGLILSTILVWVGWDIYVAIWHTGATESEVIRDWATTHPSFAFGLGVVAGHWFANVREVKYWWTMIVAWIIMAIAFVVDIGFGLLPEVYPLIPFLMGGVAGRLLWPMERVTRERDGKENP